jgi:hypothetical protein
MRDIGRMINNMEKDSKVGKMVLVLEVIMLKAKSMDKEYFLGQIQAVILGNLLIIILKVKVCCIYNNLLLFRSILMV